MKGDFSRLTFDPAKRYSGVRMQQGRLQLDADWNEQLDINAYRIETEIKDFIGQSGAPANGGGFALTHPYRALQFETSKFQRVRVLSNDILNPSNNSWTVELWFWWNSTSSRNIRLNLYSKYGLYEGAIRVNNNGKGFFQFAWARDWVWRPGDNANVDPEFEVEPNQWYHVATIYDSSAQTHTIYFHTAAGELKQWSTSHFSSPQAATSNTSDFFIGDREQKEGNVDTCFNGIIDEVRVWRSARSLQQVESSMGNFGVSSAERQDLCGYWPFDESDGDLAYDMSNYDNMGKLEFDIGAVTRLIWPNQITWRNQADLRLTQPITELRPIPNMLRISAGRYYIDGILFENLSPWSVAYSKQLDYPGAELPSEDGVYLAYLDAWQREVGAAEDPALRDPALGGADTATRTKNAWQVRLKALTEIKNQRFDPGWEPDWYEGLAISSGRMLASVTDGANLENRLYRVEIHKAGDAATATFKWSRDNAAVAAQVQDVSTTSITNSNNHEQNEITVTLSRTGRGTSSDFTKGAWVELTCEELTLNSQPGVIAMLADVHGNSLKLRTDSGIWTSFWAGTIPTSKTLVARRWDARGDAAEIELKTGEVTLDDGISVRFDQDTTAYYKTGDYWLFAARSITGDIGWPRDNSGPLMQLPHGTRHHYAPLALLERKGGTWFVTQDLRTTFQALTSGLVSQAGNQTIHGPLTIDAALSVTKDMSIGGALSVNGTGKLGNLTVSGGSTLSNLTVIDNVGIGMTTPTQAKLVVNGDIALLGAKTIKFYNQGNDTYTEIGSGATDKNKSNFWVRSADGQKYGLMFDGSTGNVGIGTTDPKVTLDVRGDIQLSGQIKATRGWNVLMLMDRQRGPLPSKTRFTTSGGICLLFVSGTASRLTEGFMRLNIQITSLDQNTLQYEHFIDLYTSEGKSRKTFPTHPIIATKVPVGEHYLIINAFTDTTAGYQTSTDGNDMYYATLCELPFGAP